MSDKIFVNKAGLQFFAIKQNARQRTLFAPKIKGAAHGGIAHFPDGANKTPVNSLICDINPVQAGTGDPSPTNVRAISGWTGATIGVNSKNLFADLSDGYFGGAGQVAAASETQQEKYTPQYIAVGDNTKITFHAENNTSVQWWAGICCYDESKTFLSRSTAQQSGISYTAVITLPARTKFVRLTARTFGSNTVQFEFGSEFTGFATPSYTGTSISWNTEAGTVYRGRLNVTTGLLQPTHYILTLNGTEASYGMSTSSGVRYFTYSSLPYTSVNTSLSGDVDNNQWSSMFMMQTGLVVGHSYVTGFGAVLLWVVDQTITTKDQMKAYFASNNAQFVLPFATLPDPIQLTPTEVTTLLGENNIWADTGDVEVEYSADTKLYIQKLTQPTEDDMVANQNIASGKYFMVENDLYYSTASIASGEQIVVGTNCNRVSLADALNNINS